MNTDDAIRRLATITDDEAARVVSPMARTQLAEQIMATTPVRSHRRRALLFGAPLAAAVMATIVVVGTALPHRGRPDVRMAALSFSTQGKYLVVKVRDPYADPKRYAQEFAAHGMKIHLTLLPVSPSIVGTVVAMEGGEGIQTITAKGRCWTGGGGFDCPVGVKVPIGYHDAAGIVFGRAARPGEQFASATSAFAPGEALHCVDVLNRTVDEALARMKRAHVSVAEYRYDPKPNFTAGARTVPGNWYVSDAIPWSPGTVLIWAGPNKQRPVNGSYYKQMMKGCRH